MIALVVLATILIAGAANVAAQRLSTHRGVETWPS